MRPLPERLNHSIAFYGILILWLLGYGGSGCGNDSQHASNPSAPTTGPVRSAEQPRPWFVDHTAASGLDFQHRTHDRSSFFMPDSLGSGVALFDYDRDGLLDLYFIQNAGSNSEVSNRLYKQTSTLQFQDVSEGSGLDVSGLGMGVAIGDVNNDGWPDVLITEYRLTRLFMNREGQRFEEVSRTCGIINPHWALSAGFLDYDRDGWLDVHIANYIDYSRSQKCSDEKGLQEFCGPSGFQPSPSLLYRNLGKTSGTTDVRFEDVSLRAGLMKINGPSMSILAADFNGDHWPDLLVANDGKPNHLWINQKNGRFTEEATARGVALNAMGQTQANMGIAMGDVDGNGLFDVFITHLNNEYHTLWLQEPQGLFLDASNQMGFTQLRQNSTAFGTIMADFDQDGDIDIVIANGSIDRRVQTQSKPDEEMPDFWKPYAQSNQVFQNQGARSFLDISALNPDFCGVARVGRGLASGDLDNDGDLDLVATYVDGRARIFLNQAGNQGNWVTFRLILPEQGGREAYGAVLELDVGNQKWVRHLNPAQSYLCSQDPRIHFGLGHLKVPVEAKIHWPDGVQERFGPLGINQIHTLEKGQGRLISLED